MLLGRFQYCPTVQLVTLLKLGLIFENISSYQNPTEKDCSEWYRKSVKSFQNFEPEVIKGLQAILLNFDNLGDSTDSSELILSQIELLDSTVRAGFPLPNENFFVSNKMNGTARPEKLAHFMQG